MFDDVDISRDQPKDRILKMGEMDITLSCTDPYGLWVIKFPKGEKMPKELKGSFTSPYEAEKWVKAYTGKK